MKIDENQSLTQAGFRKSYSTTDHLMSLGQLIEKSNEYNKKLHIAFIDFEKAIDTIELPSLIEALIEFQVPKKYIRLIRYIYENSSASIKFDFKSETFKLTRGVKQGDPMSPKLFNAVLELIFRKLNWENFGIMIGDKKLKDLRFADDVTLLSHKKEELLEMIDQLSIKAEECGLKINKAKTKVMSNTDDSDYKIEDWLIEKVENFWRMSREIDSRVSAAWRSFWALSKFLTSNLPMCHK